MTLDLASYNEFLRAKSCITADAGLLLDSGCIGHGNTFLLRQDANGTLDNSRLTDASGTRQFLHKLFTVIRHTKGKVRGFCSDLWHERSVLHLASSRQNTLYMYRVMLYNNINNAVHIMTRYRRKGGICMGKKMAWFCASCGGSFDRYPSQVYNHQRPYCSRQCAGKGNMNGTTLFCALCDSPFYRQISEQDLGVKVKQFCSRDCYRQWRAMHRSKNTYLKSGHVHTHRVVAESFLGRSLTEDEVVHHIDLDKHNNDPSNLAVFPNQSMHARCHQNSLAAGELQRYALLAMASGVQNA